MKKIKHNWLVNGQLWHDKSMSMYFDKEKDLLNYFEQSESWKEFERDKPAILIWRKVDR